MTAQVDTMALQEETPRRKSFLSRFRSKRKQEKKKLKQKTRRAPSPVSDTSAEKEDDDYKYPSRAGKVALPVGMGKSKLPYRHYEYISKDAPEARTAAFDGPPRFDWIDIETHAAIKVQAAFRRDRVMRQMEEQGMSTAAIRNRARRRNTRPGFMDGGMFSCCGVDLGFGDETVDETSARQLRREAYFQRKKEKAAYEESVRSRFRLKHLAKRGRGAGDVEEALEVVE